MEKELLKDLTDNAQRILIGIGEDMTDDPEECKKIYGILSSFLAGKDFFIVTMKTDDEILKYFPGEEKKIASPMGNRKYIQCPDGCEEALYEVTAIEGEYISHYNKNCEIVCEKNPICPVCGKMMVFNNYKAPVFLGEGCAEGWDRYNEWLTRTLNRRLVMIELETGMLNPNVIRWPLEKVAMLNEKAHLIRVHKTLAMMPAELGDKGTSVCDFSLSFLQNYLS